MITHAYTCMSMCDSDDDECDGTNVMMMAMLMMGWRSSSSGISVVARMQRWVSKKMQKRPPSAPVCARS